MKHNLLELYSPEELSELIKSKAIQIGFDFVGIAKAEKLQGYSDKYKKWIRNGYHAQMEYMERNIDKREDPTVLVEDAKSVISLITSYYPKELQSIDIPQIAKYAYGVDYHYIIKDKMNELWNFIKELHPNLKGRTFIDTAPIPDREWAVKAGVGWVGKNGCLINKEIGSFTFISELVVNIELQYDKPYTANYCGSCTKCIDACPTKAIVKDGIIDSNRCISYQTIENKEDIIPDNLIGLFNNYIFGCDICQNVCPWNKSPLITNIKEFKPYPEVLNMNMEEWSSITKEEFNKIFKKSPLKRAKYDGIKRNINFLKKKKVVLFAPLNWGLGHATRDIPLINAYLSKGYSVLIAANGNAKKILEIEFPNIKFIDIPEFNVRYTSKVFFMPFLILQMPFFYLSFYKEYRILKKVIKKYKISMVISDNRYGLWNRDIKSVIITHQLFIKLPRYIRFMEPLLHYITRRLVAKFDECWVPDYKDVDNCLSGELSHGKDTPNNVKYINPLSRFNFIIKEESKKVDIPDVLVIISGQEPYRSFFETEMEDKFKKSSEKVLFILGTPNNFIEDTPIYLSNGITKVTHIKAELLGFYIRNAKQIISRSGYSTIMDLHILGVSAHFIPTPNQPEQEYLAEYSRQRS